MEALAWFGDLDGGLIVDLRRTTFQPLSWRTTFRHCPFGGLHFGIYLLRTWSTLEELMFGGLAHSWRLGASGVSLV